MGLKKKYGDNSLYEVSYPRYSLLNARIQFISAVSKYAPEVFIDLHDMTLRSYQDSPMQSLNRKRRVDFWRLCSPADLYGKSEEAMGDLTKNAQAAILHHAYQFLFDWGLNPTRDEDIDSFNRLFRPCLMAFFESMEEWAGNYNLRAGWVYHWAFLKLDTYLDKREPNNPIYHELNPPIRKDIFGSDVQPPVIEEFCIDQITLYDYWIEEFQFRSDPWRPLVQTKGDCEKRIRADFEIALTRYFQDGVRYLDLRPELERSRTKAQPEHYKWAACYQCLAEQTIGDLAKKANRDRSVVSDAIHDITDFIGLDLKPESRGGRTRGSKDKEPRRVVKGKNR